MRSGSKKQRWSELSTKQRTGIVSAGVVQVSLQLAALVDIRRRPQDEIHGSKPLWIALSFVNTLGPIAYFVFGRRT